MLKTQIIELFLNQCADANQKIVFVTAFGIISGTYKHNDVEQPSKNVIPINLQHQSDGFQSDSVGTLIHDVEIITGSNVLHRLPSTYVFFDQVLAVSFADDISIQGH